EYGDSTIKQPRSGPPRGQNRSFDDVGPMSGLPESGHGWAIYEYTPLTTSMLIRGESCCCAPAPERRRRIRSAEDRARLGLCSGARHAVDIRNFPPDTSALMVLLRCRFFNPTENDYERQTCT